ncbi:MAG: zinc ribbon domain-containing protein [Acutalibacteraceae bacterium]|nr:zinc ribbon domain-containing protein [Acutalibacteraceae bacterium]
MFCKNCGKEILDQAVVCPGCGCAVAENTPTNDKKKKKKPGCLIAIVIIVALFLILAVIIGSGDSSDTPTNNSDVAQSSDQVQESNKLIYEDDYIKASYIKVYSDPVVDASVEGVVYLQLLVENKSDETLTVALSKAAVNGMSTTIGGGVPMTILPGNSSQQPFIIFTKNTNVKNADDIEKLQFSFYLMNDKISKVKETKTISFDVK